MASKYISWFNEVGKEDVGKVGGKGANLGEMTQNGFPVPYGFVVTADAYFDFIEEANLKQKIGALLSFVNFDNQTELEAVSSNIGKLILSAQLPSKLVHSIVQSYDQLENKEHEFYKRNVKTVKNISNILGLTNQPLVAVRSSATAEDLPEASFAGQQETYLNVRGENNLLHKIRECYASLFTARAIYYRHHNNFDHMKVGLAAVVQRMIQSDVSGIAFSLDPVTGNKSVVTIEAIYGLGEYIVQGKVTPDHYEIDKKDNSIHVKNIKKQTIAYVRKDRSNHEVTIPAKFQELQKLKDDQIVELSNIVKNIEKHYFFPQDIEWALEKSRLYIVQARPVTTIGGNNDSTQGKSENKLLLTGDPASPGVGTGKPVIIHKASEIDKVVKGSILIAPMTDPDFVPAMKRASAIITERGGRTSHAAIVSRELGLPAIVGAVGAIKTLAHEKIISVNGSTGEIFRGNVKINLELKTQSSKTNILVTKKLKTITKVYVNLAEVERAKEVADMNVDGVGLLRAEFMVADIGTHPKEFIKSGRENVFVDKLATKLEKFVSVFAPRPVVYRATDFKTNEYRHLQGGKLYEPIEENPMLGYRGASRYITDRAVFKMELEAILKVRNKGYKNLHLMIPFVRSPHELIEIKKMLEAVGLSQSHNFKLWIMVEIPSVALTLDRYIALGIDGISVGTNDLTMLTLGVDRDNASISNLYNETDPAVTYLLERIVKTAKKAGVTVSVCGQAASDYADLRERLIRLGVTSLSVNIDTIDRVRQDIYDFEKKLWQK